MGMTVPALLPVENGYINGHKWSEVAASAFAFIHDGPLNWKGH